MSDAKVTFDRMDKLGALPGEEQQFNFACPRKAGSRCEGLLIRGRTNVPHDPQGKNGGVAQWQWDGDRAAPTFSPSINCGWCGWHGYLERGRCVNTRKQDEPEPVAPERKPMDAMREFDAARADALKNPPE